MTIVRISKSLAENFNELPYLTVELLKKVKGYCKRNVCHV